jgi:ABC-type branched-subunit amino acid transport system substrate-binding protein
LDIEEGLAKLKADPPEAVVFIGTYKPFAKLVKAAKKQGLQSRFLTVSFIGTAAFMKEAGAEGNGVIITQVMPSILNSSSSLVGQYLKDHTRGEVTYGSLEGYANALVLVTALQKAGKDLTRESLVKTLEQLNTNVGGLKVSFSAKDHQGLSSVYITQVKDGKALEINQL